MAGVLSLGSEAKSVNDKNLRWIVNQPAESAILYGGIAQLGERLNGIQEARGSSPLISSRLKFTTSTW